MILGNLLYLGRTTLCTKINMLIDSFTGLSAHIKVKNMDNWRSLCALTECSVSEAGWCFSVKQRSHRSELKINLWLLQGGKHLVWERFSHTHTHISLCVVFLFCFYLNYAVELQRWKDGRWHNVWGHRSSMAPLSANYRQQSRTRAWLRKAFSWLCTYSYF